MLEFKLVTIEDKSWIDEKLLNYESMSCSDCFGNVFIWKNVYRTKVANIDGFYVAQFSYTDNNKEFFFSFPKGEGDLKAVITKLIEYCHENNAKFSISGCTNENKEILEKLCPNQFKFIENRDYFDYIYTVESLTNLSGKKLHGKRNHIKRFKDNNWSFEKITNENLFECQAMNEKWCKIHECGKSQDLKNECCAVKRSFKYFNELNFFGGLLRVDGEVVAYTIAEKLNSNTVVVHIEKAFSEIQGAYPTINREFIANCCQDYDFVNREEDVGVEGLRKAKLSYQPHILLEKYIVELK